MVGIYKTFLLRNKSSKKWSNDGSERKTERNNKTEFNSNKSYESMQLVAVEFIKLMWKDDEFITQMKWKKFGDF